MHFGAIKKGKKTANFSLINFYFIPKTENMERSFVHGQILSIQSKEGMMADVGMLSQYAAMGLLR